MEETFYRIFDKELEFLGLQLDDSQKKQFWDYYNLMIEWNQVMNLTTITEMDEVILKHFIDSLMLGKAADLSESKEISLIDIGTGAGFPGIPLKIVYPHLKIVLLDSLNKRVKFLNTVIDSLSLKDIVALHGRAEEYGRMKEYREKFDIVVSRAVANISTLSEYCIPYVKIGGQFISYKSGEIEEEINNGKSAIKKLGGEIQKIIPFQLSNTDISRSFIVITKVSNTKMKFPRKAGLPSKEPLK